MKGRSTNGQKKPNFLTALFKSDDNICVNTVGLEKAKMLLFYEHALE